MGFGGGRGLGWFSVGYGDELDRGAAMKNALEARTIFLRAELARAEALLKEGVGQSSPKAEGTETK